jgi:ADP-ribose pyrophosphatase YjhB (NUDIX family)
MPGGYVDIGDCPSEAAVRETAEEAGVEARVHRLVGVFDSRLRPEAPPHLFHVHKLVFLGELRDPDARPHGQHETVDAAFHNLDDLPELSLARTSPFHIQQAVRIHTDRNGLPYFD